MFPVGALTRLGPVVVLTVAALHGVSEITYDFSSDVDRCRAVPGKNDC